MVEVARSKLYYSRARTMFVLPTFRPLASSGETRVILSTAIRTLAGKWQERTGAAKQDLSSSCEREDPEEGFSRMSTEMSIRRISEEAENAGRASGDMGFGRTAGETSFGRPAGEASFGRMSSDLSGRRMFGDASFGRASGDASFGRMPGDSSFSRLPGDSSFSRLPGDASFSRMPGDASFGRMPPQASFQARLSRTDTTKSITRSHTVKYLEKENYENTLLAVMVLTDIRNKHRYSEYTYFGRAWTLAERMARHGREESLRHWLDLEVWMGMTLDALWQASDPSVEEVEPVLDYYWGKIFDRWKSMAVIESLRKVRQRGSSLASNTLNDQIAELFIDAVQVRLSFKSALWSEPDSPSSVPRVADAPPPPPPFFTFSC